MSSIASSTDSGTTAHATISARHRATGQSHHWTGPYAAKRIHLVGIGGCGMSGLAGVLLRCGAIVSGSDARGSTATRQLEDMGARITIGQAPINIHRDFDAVVYSAAIGPDNPELMAARAHDIPCMRYADMLGQVMRLRTGIAISGTHGKSTTTAMLAHTLRVAHKDPTFVVGAEVRQLGGSSAVGDGEHFIVEACEFDRSFHSYYPTCAAILNIEEDHLDCFQDLNDITDAFRVFVSQVQPHGVVVANAENRAVARAVSDAPCPVETFGFDEGATWRAQNVDQQRGCYSFEVFRNGNFMVHVELSRLPGRHQVGNALAAIALATHAGVAPDVIAAALSNFAGAERRMSFRGEGGGIVLLDDYAHHPTEVQVTLRAIREHHSDRRVWVIFQPHQHSRTRFLLSDFARSFGLADHLLVPDIYFVRDSDAEREQITSADLVEQVRLNGGEALYLPTAEEIIDHVIANAEFGDVVVTMGAGDVWKISDELARRLS